MALVVGTGFCASPLQAADKDDEQGAGVRVVGEESSADAQTEGSGDSFAAPGREIEEIRKKIEEHLRLSIHGAVVGYYQGMNNVRIQGEEYKNPDGAGFVADLEFAFAPLEGGEFVLRIHAGEGDGADRDLAPAGALFGDLNTLNDDNPGDDGVSLLEAFYTHTFFDEKLLISAGKTEPLVFLDDNAFANDEYAQFVGKPLVNNPVLDTENEFGPLATVRIAPFETLAFALVFQSSSRPRLEEDQQKSTLDRVFDEPFLAGQLFWSPQIAGLKGNYRVNAWAQTYDHPRLSGAGTEEGWGVGLSLDQGVHERVGLFARFGYQNRDVYEVPWLWSGGAQLLGLVPGREDDQLGLGIAGLKANDELEGDGTEYHLEGYYRLSFGEHLAISPDIQYVVDPLGHEHNEDVVAGMLRVEGYF